VTFTAFDKTQTRTPPSPKAHLCFHLFATGNTSKYEMETKVLSHSMIQNKKRKKTINQNHTRDLMKKERQMWSDCRWSTSDGYIMTWEELYTCTMLFSSGILPSSCPRGKLSRIRTFKGDTLKGSPRHWRSPSAQLCWLFSTLPLPRFAEVRLHSQFASLQLPRLRHFEPHGTKDASKLPWPITVSMRRR